MEQSPSWEANSSSASEGISHILWNQKVQYRVHKSPPLFPILSQINPVLTGLFNFHLSFHVRQGFQVDSLPRCSCRNTVCTFPVLYIFHIPCQSYFSWFAYPNIFIYLSSSLIMHEATHRLTPGCHRSPEWCLVRSTVADVPHYAVSSFLVGPNRSKYDVSIQATYIMDFVIVPFSRPLGSR